MRFLVYNIAYGTGTSSIFPGHLWTMHRYLRTSRTHLEKILSFISETDPDIIGLLEVDTGSYRTNYVNQLEVIANHVNHHQHSSVKYGRRFLENSVPILRKQANAILTKDKIPAGKFHFFPVGFKRLIIEVEVGGVRIFLVHLALKRYVRARQLEHLAALALERKGPMIIAGDFNTFDGEEEIFAMQTRLGLFNPNREAWPTFPSWKPRRQLDFVLCSRSIKINSFSVPGVRYSDHLPIILDFGLQ